MGKYAALNVDIDGGEVNGRGVIDGSRVDLAAAMTKNGSVMVVWFERGYASAEIKLIGVAAGLASNDDIVALGRGTRSRSNVFSPHDDCTPG